MKTTKEIINDELGIILNSVDYDVNNALFEINKNKKWYSEEEIKKALKVFDFAIQTKNCNPNVVDEFEKQLLGDEE